MKKVCEGWSLVEMGWSLFWVEMQSGKTSLRGWHLDKDGDEVRKRECQDEKEKHCRQWEQSVQRPWGENQHGWGGYAARVEWGDVGGRRGQRKKDIPGSTSPTSGPFCFRCSFHHTRLSSLFGNFLICPLVPAFLPPLQWGSCPPKASTGWVTFLLTAHTQCIYSLHKDWVRLGQLLGNFREKWYLKERKQGLPWWSSS